MLLLLHPAKGVYNAGLFQFGCNMQERRERLMKEQLEKMRADNPKITEQFADLKRDLAQVRYGGDQSARSAISAR